MLFDHTIDQVRCHNGIADLIEDYVEHAHQTRKQLDHLAVFLLKRAGENTVSVANK